MAVAQYSFIPEFSEFSYALSYSVDAPVSFKIGSLCLPTFEKPEDEFSDLHMTAKIFSNGVPLHQVHIKCVCQVVFSDILSSF